MGYLYSKVKDAIKGGLSEKECATMKSWSPNMYKCLVIGVEYIFVVVHGGSPKVIKLDRDSVERDIDGYLSGKSLGAIHSLITSRQMSCLEEIYLDRVYSQLPTMFDMSIYASKAVNTESRLRYYGYCDTDNALGYLQSMYTQVCINRDYTYCLGEDNSKPFNLSCYKGSDDWYKKYNLRPMYYQMDREKGYLDVYFRKVEKLVSAKIEGAKEEESAKYICDLMSCILNVDDMNIRFLSKLLRLKTFLSATSNSDMNKAYKIVSDVLNKSSSRKVTGLTASVFKKIVESGISSGIIQVRNMTVLTNILNSYQRLGIFDTDTENTLDVKKLELKTKTGLIDIYEIYDNIALQISDEYMKKPSTAGLIRYNLRVYGGEIPEGNFRKKYLVGEQQSPSIMGYVGYLSDVIGVDLNEVEG